MTEIFVILTPQPRTPSTWGYGILARRFCSVRSRAPTCGSSTCPRPSSPRCQLPWEDGSHASRCRSRRPHWGPARSSGPCSPCCPSWSAGWCSPPPLRASTASASARGGSTGWGRTRPCRGCTRWRGTRIRCCSSARTSSNNVSPSGSDQTLGVLASRCLF